jgi:hypothetical protein
VFSTEFVNEECDLIVMFEYFRRSDLSDLADEKTAEAGAGSRNVKTFEQLMAELAELESRIQQSAEQSASLRVIILDCF